MKMTEYLSYHLNAIQLLHHHIGLVLPVTKVSSLNLRILTGFTKQVFFAQNCVVLI